MKFLKNCLFLILFTAGAYLQATSIETEVKKAKGAESKGVVKCHPKGENGGVTPLQANKQLKPGMTLVLLPGPWSDFGIHNDKIIVTTEGKKIEYPIKLTGRDCIIKNSNFSTLYTNRDCVIIDSMIDYLHTGYDNQNNKEKIDVYIYNTAIKNFSPSSHNTTAELKNCLVKGEINCRSELKLTITDSVLCSERILFKFTDYSNRKGRLTLKDNLIYTEKGYGEMTYSPSPRKNGMIISELKNLKKLWTVSILGENLLDAPTFQKNKLFLTEDSKGQGKGLIPDEHPMFEILKQREEEEERERAEKEKAEKDEKSSDHEERKKIREQRREDARKRREERLKKKHPHRRDKDEKDTKPEPKPEEKEDDIIGIPKPPE